MTKKLSGFTVMALIAMLCVVVATPVQAEVRKITGIVVDADSREKLEAVSLELLSGGVSEKSLTVTSSDPFIIEHDFAEKKNYQLIFKKADYYQSEVDLSSALAGGQMPAQMTVAMSGDESSFIFWGTSLDRDSSSPISNALVTKTNRMTGEQSKIQSNLDGRYSYMVSSKLASKHAR